MWKSLSDAERQPYVAHSEKLRELHRKQYPDYKYKPKKKLNQETPTPGSRYCKSKTQTQGKVSKSTKKLSKKKMAQQARALRQESVELESECSNDDYYEEIAYSPDSGYYDNLSPAPPEPEGAKFFSYSIQNGQVSSVNYSQTKPSNTSDADSLMQFMAPIIDQVDEFPLASDIGIDFTPTNAQMDFDLNHPNLLDTIMDDLDLDLKFPSETGFGQL